MKRSPQRTVALAFQTGTAHLVRTFQGIMHYAREHGGWSFVTSPETHWLPISSLQGWDGDGVIAMVNSRADERVATALNSPVISISGVLPSTRLYRVTVDYAAIARLAADHFLSRGFRRFGFYGVQQVWYSELYKQAFLQRIGEFGGTCRVYEGPSSLDLQRPWQQDLKRLDRWLASLKVPIAIMAPSDHRARMVLEACQRRGIQIPQEIAVIGASNDSLVCESCDPPLSTVARSEYQVGYQAARLLDQLMEGRPATLRHLLIPPEQVVPRASTDVFGVDDPRLQAAIRHVQKHFDEPITVLELAEAIGVSRRWLEYAFASQLGRTPRRFLCELRVDRARLLLDSPEPLKLRDIARRCGFGTPVKMNAAFQQVTGARPKDFRPGACPPRHDR